MRALQLSLVIVLNLVTFEGMAQNTETQDYRVVKTVGDVEIRYYPPVMKIQSDGNFNPLFNYISGFNEADVKISMTTPVYMGDSEGNPVMEFVLPKTFNESNTPESKSQAVRVFESQPGTFAAVTFGGYASEASKQKYAAQLKSVLEEHGIPFSGEPMLLVYNSPYQFFGRKNEVLIKVDVEVQEMP